MTLNRFTRQVFSVASIFGALSSAKGALQYKSNNSHLLTNNVIENLVCYRKVNKFIPFYSCELKSFEPYLLNEKFVIKWFRIRFYSCRQCHLCKRLQAALRFAFFASLAWAAQARHHFEHTQWHCVMHWVNFNSRNLLKFMYSKKATKFCEIFP